MIYLDYNSTHPPVNSILEKNLEIYFQNFANPSGISYQSQKNFSLIENARKKVKELLKTYYGFDSPSMDVVFTSTGTEAVYQMIYSYFNPDKPYAIVSPYEHDCFYGSCELLKINVLMLPAYNDGMVHPEDILKIFDEYPIKPEDVSFIGTIAVSNETGIIQPLKEISHIAKQLNIPLISDTIQINGKRVMDLSYLDACTINGHKIGGGYGTAILASKSSNLKPIFKGGLQENELRAGTENLFSILNTVEAFEWQMHNQASYVKLYDYQTLLETFLKDECNAIIIGENSPRINSTIYAIFPELEDMDFVLLSLDQENIVCSTGSSCKSRTRQPSPNLLRMGYDINLSQQALRFSYGIFTKKEEIDIFIKKFKYIYDSILKTMR